MELVQVNGPGVGLNLKSQFCTAWNRTGATLTEGEVVMFDLGDTDAGTTTSLVIGNDGSVLANVIDPATNGIGALSGGTIRCGYYFGVYVGPARNGETTPGGDDTLVRIQVSGVARVSMVATAITVGVALFAANGVNTLTPTVAAGNKCLAIAWEPNGSAAGVFTCLFDGITGFGYPCAS